MLGCSLGEVKLKNINTPLITLYFHFSTKLPDSYLWPRFKDFEVKFHMAVKAHTFFQYTALPEKEVEKLREIITKVI